MGKTINVQEIDGKQRVSATDARVHFGELMRLVRDSGDVIYVDCGRETMLKLVPVEPGEMESSEEPPWLRKWKSVQEDMAAYLSDKTLYATPEELIREDRDSR